MPGTLYETLCQIDPYVKLNDGLAVRTVEQVIFSSDPADPTEYAMFSDPVGRLLIYQVSDAGKIVRPPVFIEEKVTPSQGKSRKAPRYLV